MFNSPRLYHNVSFFLTPVITEAFLSKGAEVWINLKVVFSAIHPDLHFLSTA
jgi:hypothetical protein